MPRADRQTETSVQQEYYSDFAIGFSKNPVTGILSRLSNEDSVKQSMKILLFSILGEWPHANHIGSQMNNVLFEQADAVSASVLESTIRDVLRIYEPRITVLSVVIQNDSDNNAYNVQIMFGLLNTTIVSTLNVILKRVR